MLEDRNLTVKEAMGAILDNQYEVLHLPSIEKTNSLPLERRGSERRHAQRAGLDVHRMTRKLTLRVAL